MASIDYVDEIEVSETHVSNMIQYDKGHYRVKLNFSLFGSF